MNKVRLVQGRILSGIIFDKTTYRRGLDMSYRLLALGKSRSISIEGSPKSHLKR